MSNKSEKCIKKEKIIIKNQITKNKYKKSFPSNPKYVFKAFFCLKKAQIKKLFISFIIIFLFGLFNNINIIGNPQPENKCYNDKIHDITEFLNYYFRGNDKFRKFFTILGSLAIDILFLVSSILWAIYSIDWRYFINIMLFYGIRYIMNESSRLRCPDLIYLPYPGVPSIVVGYIQGSDFFFSGHCGFPILSMMEFIWVKKFWLASYSGFVILVETFLMEISREHYTIDIIVGVIFAHYITIYGRKIVDFFYDKIPFLKKLKKKNIDEMKKLKFNWILMD